MGWEGVTKHPSQLFPSAKAKNSQEEYSKYWYSGISKSPVDRNKTGAKVPGTQVPNAPEHNKLPRGVQQSHQLTNSPEEYSKVPSRQTPGKATNTQGAKVPSAPARSHQLTNSQEEYSKFPSIQTPQRSKANTGTQRNTAKSPVDKLPARPQVSKLPRGVQQIYKVLKYQALQRATNSPEEYSKYWY